MNKRFPSLDDVLLHCGELNKRETVAVQWALKAAHEYMLNQQKINEWQEKVLQDRLLEEHRKYHNAKGLDWSKIAVKKMLSHLMDFGFLQPTLTLEQAMQAMTRYFFEHEQRSIGHRGSKTYDAVLAEFQKTINPKQ